MTRETSRRHGGHVEPDWVITERARRATSRSRSESPGEGYVGRRVAGSATDRAGRGRRRTSRLRPARSLADPVHRRRPQSPRSVFSATTTGSLRARACPASAAPPRRSREPLLRGLPSMPVVVGVAALAVSAGGVLGTNGTQLAASAGASRTSAPNARPARSAAGSTTRSVALRSVSRDSDRDALDDASEADPRAEVELQAEQRNKALGDLAVAGREGSQDDQRQPVGAAGRRLPPDRDVR